LRENFEFKAAKEMQRVLMRRRAEMERDVSIARGTDFANPDLTQVSIGTTVTLRDLSTGAVDVYSVLGAWDGDPERNIISYQTAIGQAILGHKPGEHVTIPTEQGERQAEIVSVEPYRGTV
jgi:transcription elongation GreA/GreB family factor